VAGGAFAARAGGGFGWLIGAAALAAAGGALFAVTAYGAGPLLLPAALVAVAAAAATLIRPAWGVAAALLASPLEFANLPLPSGALSPSEVLFALVAVGWMGRALLTPGTVALPAPRDAPLLVLLGTFIAGLWVAVDAADVIRVIAFWIAFYFVYLQAQSFRLEEIRLVVIAFAIAGGVLGLIGTVNYLTSGNTNLFAGGLGTGARASGTFGDPNYYASLLVLAVAPGLALLLAYPRRHLVLVPAVLGAVAGLAFSLSRGGVVGFAVAAALLAIAWRRGRVAALAFVAVLAVATVLSVNPLTGVEEVGSVGERLGTLNSSLITTDRRPEIWRTAVEVTQDHPLLGVGVKQFQYAANDRGLTEFGRPVDNVHNIPLNFAAENGIIGSVAFLVFLVMIVARGIRAASRSERLPRALALGLLAVMAGFIVQGLTQTQTRVNVIAGAFFVVAGLITALADRAALADPD
jgi:O-antigen ligase